MAITRRGEAENSATNGADFDVTHPAGLVENDVIYLTVTVGTLLTDTDFNMTAPTGWTELADLYANDTAETNLAVFRKVMGVTPDSTATISNPGGFGQGCAAVEIALIGVDTTTPEDATTTTATGIDTGTPDGASITTVTDGAWVLTCVGNPDSDTTITAPTGYSNQVDRNSAASEPCTTGMTTKEVTTAAAENPGAWTNMSTNAANSWCAATVAVRPAGGGGIDTSESRSGTSAGTATGTGTKAVQDAKCSTVSAGATVTGRVAVQDAKRSTVNGTATVTGVSTFANANWEQPGTSTGTATVVGRSAVQDAKRSTVSAGATATGTLIQEVSLSRAGTASGSSTVTVREEIYIEVRAISSSSATVTGVSDFTDESRGIPAAAATVRDAPFIVNVGSLMMR
jgi:hypothetical protein